MRTPKVRGRVPIATNTTPTCCVEEAMSEQIDDRLTASQGEHNVSEARRRRHRSTRRGGSATIRSNRPPSGEGRGEAEGGDEGETEGGEEGESSSVYSSSAPSTSARCELRNPTLCIEAYVCE